MLGIPNEDFFSGIKERFEFLIAKFGFKLESEDVSERFDVPSITYRLDNISIQIARGRGSLKVLIRYSDEIEVSGTFGEILYFLDHGTLPTERISGYSPKPNWEQDSAERLLEQMNWYRDQLMKQLKSVIALFESPERQSELQKFAALKYERQRALGRFLDSNKNRNAH